MWTTNHSSRFIEMQRTSNQHNELGDFIVRCVPERCGERELPVLSVTKEYAMVHQNERFEATVVSRDKSNYIVVPRGYLVQGIHIDESNFGIQNLVDEGIVSPAYKLWRFKNQDAIPELIEYYLRSEMAIKYFKRHFLGSTVPRRQVIKKDDFLSMPLNLPKKAVQESYFAFFKQADKSKFGDFKSRFIEQFAKCVQSQKLGDVVKLMDDKRKPINDAERQSMKTGELYPYYGATGQVDMINSYLTDDTLLCIAEDCGNYKEGEESSYIITGKAWVNNHAHLVKPNDNCDITFLHYYLTICDLTPYVTGTTRQKLTQKSLVSIPVIFPSIGEQRLFVSIVQQADKSKYMN